MRLLRKPWFMGISALSLCICLLGLSGVVFAQSKHLAGSPPPVGTWTQKLQGYQVLSLVTAQSNPSIVYACVVNQDGRVQLLRSNDFGDNWQNKTIKTSLKSDCEIAVSFVHADTVYGVGKKQGTLLYTHDGGKTWHTLHPLVSISGQKKTIAWSAGQISTATGALFSVQSLAMNHFTSLRLLRSTDSGNTWKVIDSHFTQTKTKRGERDYAVNPQDPQTIYELVGREGYDGVLYQTTDGGSNWIPKRSNLPHGTRVSVAGGKPAVVVVGVPQPNGVQLHISTDAGSNWNTVPLSQQITSLQNWLVAPDGLVYASTLTTATTTATPTAASATPTESSDNTLDLFDGTPAGRSVFASADLQLTIEDFDPSADQWSEVVQAPQLQGILLLVSTSSDGHTVFWFESGNVLYQEVLSAVTSLDILCSLRRLTSDGCLFYTFSSEEHERTEPL